MEGTINVEAFKKLLPSICDKETSQDPDNWTSENPLGGHSTVVSLIAQNLFGGELPHASLSEIPKFERIEPQQRSHVLSHAETKRRYKLLAFRLAKVLNNGNALFGDPIYQQCFDAALDSECQKMEFGCVIMGNVNVIYSGCNETIEPLKSICDPKCRD